MKLYMPTKVYNEKNCVENHSRELAALGTKALIVTGKHSSRINGFCHRRGRRFSHGCFQGHFTDDGEPGA